MKQSLKYVLLAVALIVIGLLTWNLVNVWRDQTRGPLVDPSATQGFLASETLAFSQTPSITSSSTATVTATATATSTATSTSTATRAATRVPTATLTSTPKPAPPVVVNPTDTPGPTGDGYVGGTPWDYTVTPVFTPGVP